MEGIFKLGPAPHGDFVGAVPNTGVVPEKVGNIIVRVLVAPEPVGFLGIVTQVRGVPAETSPIPLSDDVAVLSYHKGCV